MKIYVAHPTDYTYREELYRPLLSIKQPGLEFTLPHLHPGTFTNSKDTIQGCDIVLAEVSRPSIGLGIELGWAETFGVPIVAIHKVGVLPTSALSAVTTRVMTYSDLAQLVSIAKSLTD